MPPEIPSSATHGWRLPSSQLSLPEVHGSIAVPEGAGFWRKMFAFAGPGYLVAVGYMDPGNWATDLAGGARFGYTLLSVIMLSNLMAILLQALAARLGIASGRDLAQACRDSYSRPTTIVLWVLCEIAIAACDLAEVIGAAIALNLLFGLPLTWGVSLTALDVIIVLYLQHRGFRYVEALVVGLILAIAGSFAVEIWLSRPNLAGVVSGFVPRVEILRNGELLAGQIVMEGFINLRLRPWLRRLITRLIAIIPAIIVVVLYGEHGTGQLIILSQVILSLQLPFAVFPLVMFTSDPSKMGPFVSPPWVKALAWVVAVIIALLNGWLLYQTFAG